MGGFVDMGKMGLLGQTMKDKVQPDMENLEENMEENEAAQAGEEKEPEKLGRLQFKLDYDFQQNQVNFFWFFVFVHTLSLLFKKSNRFKFFKFFTFWLKKL